MLLTLTIPVFRAFLNAVIEKMWGLFFIAIPFSVIGITYKTYDFSVPTIIILLISALYILRGQFQSCFKWIYIYILYVFISCCILFLLKGYNSFPSFLLLLLFLIPITSSVKINNAERIVQYIIAGLYISFIFFIYEYIVARNGSINLLTANPFALKAGISSHLRVSGGFKEPSWYAFYLFNCMVFLKRNFPQKKITIWLTIIFIFISTSLAGILLVIAYFGIEIAKGKHAGIVIISVCALLIFLTSDISNKYVSYYYNKTLKSFNSVGHMRDDTSEALRINAFIVGVKYFEDAGTGTLKAAFGEGYAFQQVWIKEKFKGFINEFGKGYVTNLLIVTFISLGFIGLILFLKISWIMSLHFYSKSMFFIFLIYLSSLGFLIFFLTWHIFYLGLFNINEQNNEKTDAYPVI